ncbi:hypothetical protein CLI64_09260 [Nostoc sp. CENA543]|uniref:hypothetical protein n=1 Tax=Nostoc sp. CENA543 TaxID=1869241 RepID=UPI000CA322C7|nr:hypothetical protein [Nostoc sp. CENA543]AUT00561.1 hypothetical protein CLI64_09260 [Nostoc sp. CENA543]
MKRIILYPLMTVLLVGIAGKMAMTQVVKNQSDKQLAKTQLVAALEPVSVINTKNIDEKTALNLVWKLPLVQRKAKEIERLSKRTIKVSAIVESIPNPNNPYYTVRVFEDDPNNYNFTIYWFRVFQETGVIEALDVVENRYVSLDEWREQIRRRN